MCVVVSRRSSDGEKGCLSLGDYRLKVGQAETWHGNRSDMDLVYIFRSAKRSDFSSSSLVSESRIKGTSSLKLIVNDEG